MAVDLPPWLFVADNIASGFGGLLVGPFLVPFIIDADPTRRAAVQSGAAQLVGGAAGPLLAAMVVSDAHVRGVIWLACGLLIAGLALVATLRFSGRR
jgi:MFS family permease